MNNRATMLSLMMGVIAVFFVSSYVTSIEESVKKKFDVEVQVIVAAREIREMETINETMLEFKAIPKTFVEPTAIFEEPTKDGKENPKVTKIKKNLAGTIAVVPIKKGEQVTFNKLTDPSIKTGLAPQIAPGRRAISIPVSESTAVSKLIKPGDRVDLIAVVDLGGGKENKVAKTVLQDIVVLSIGKYITNNAARSVEVDPVGGKDRVRSLAEDFSYTTVSLEVEPAQVQVLSLLLNSSDNALTLSLRNNDDIERINYPQTTLVDVFGAEAIARAKANSQGKR